ncbi:hypothetical protein CC86DRAFT_385982 [Ophiobolus disseminans]|uniref:Protein kinase domain-containing protein n=1 Tax=Ophiobolus disseminans TaxID=1469910 RepID=A0A6A6ZNR1_9PLEO|nr:hypothetical protein CC86DRAFT_385982 [Ophiobolus disseminans]
MSQLVAVKEYTEGNKEARERDILLAIKTGTTSVNGGLNIAQILNYDRTHEFPKWLILSTLPAFCTLQAFCDKVKELKTQLPYQLVWFFFLEISRAFQFLHDECDPPIAHLDLHDLNVLVGFDNSEYSGLPTIRIIDFDAAKLCSIHDVTRMIERDTAEFKLLVSDIASLAMDEAGSTGCDVLDNFQRECNQRQHDTLNSVLWDVGGTPAECVERLSDAEVQDINILVRSVVKPNLQHIRDAVRTKFKE